MNKATVCTHVGCVISYDRNDSPGCVGEGCAMLRAVPTSDQSPPSAEDLLKMANYKHPLPDGLRITDKDRKEWGYDRCTSCGMKLYSGAHHTCPKPFQTNPLTDSELYWHRRGVKNYVDPDKYHTVTEGDRTYHIRKLDIMDLPDQPTKGRFEWTDESHTEVKFVPEDTNVNESGQQERSDPITVHYQSQKGIDMYWKPRYARDYTADADATLRSLRYHPNVEALLTVWQITYRILAQIPLPGQPLYSNAYNLPI